MFVELSTNLLFPKLNEGVAAALAGAVAATSGFVIWKPLRVGVEVVVAGGTAVVKDPKEVVDAEVDSWNPVDADVDSWNPVDAAVLVAVAAASNEGFGEFKLKLGTVAAEFLVASVLGAWLEVAENVVFGTTGEVEETTGAWIEVVTLVTDDMEAKGVLAAAVSLGFTSSISGSGST